VTLGLALVTWFALVVDAAAEVLSARDIARQPDRFAATPISARFSLQRRPA
jgi:hypothetical protein